jgi:UDP-2-acetamido-3-amino-2,3-dideoxy-glucuronate N-acetyltransferase
MTGVHIDPLARVEEAVTIGDGSRVWASAHIRAGAALGHECNVGENVFIDLDVTIGDRCKIQNNALLFHGVVLEDGVFIGPGAILTNDRHPRAITPTGELKTADDWSVSGVRVCRGAALGAQCVVVAGVTIGEWALVGAGAVVIADVAAHSMVAGNPARQIGTCCRCGVRVGAETCATCGYPESA